MALGTVAYWNTGAQTALIPGYFGIPLCILGFIGLWSAPVRKHVMHAAVLVTTIGFLMAVGRMGYSLVMAISGSEIKSKALLELLLMALLCAGHVALSVKSFLAARRRRQQAGANPT